MLVALLVHKLVRQPEHCDWKSGPSQQSPEEILLLGKEGNLKIEIILLTSFASEERQNARAKQQDGKGLVFCDER